MNTIKKTFTKLTNYRMLHNISCKILSLMLDNFCLSYTVDVSVLGLTSLRCACGLLYSCLWPLYHLSVVSAELKHLGAGEHQNYSLFRKPVMW